MKPKRKRGRDFKLLGFVIFGRKLFSLKKNHWLQNSKHHLFSPIQAPIARSEDRNQWRTCLILLGESFELLACKQREFCVPLGISKPLTFIPRLHSLSFLWNQQNSHHWYANEGTNSSHTIHFQCALPARILKRFSAIQYTTPSMNLTRNSHPFSFTDTGVVCGDLNISLRTVLLVKCHWGFFSFGVSCTMWDINSLD